MFNNLLLAADGSEHSIRAAKHVISIAKCNPISKVHIIYVIASSTSKSDVLAHYDHGAIGEKRKAKVKPIEEMLQEANVTYESHFIHGEPGPTIVKYANDVKNEIDLLVIGSRGLNTLQEMVLGSVSHKVAKRANCPVMIVK